ncbi:hypothetical protein MNAN1_003784 [Malassezia nana]|uniref:PIN domain-like protein n=1 Tax=Malassezia nana TaxID=180528 RepID=A0AAF0EMG4_9BASI|nr:hypothetical protein MNAN1_003784 [Malassezia nana]
MGVLGLTRWANESERLVSSELTLPIPSNSGHALENGEPIQLSSEGDWLVIDAWAWIHYVWHSMNTNVYQGGSLLHFRVHLISWIEKLWAAGFHLLVVFDGPRLHQKIGPILTRTQNYVRLNAKLMRAGPNLRTDHEFELARMLPRGLNECVQDVLKSCDVEMIMGAEEVDSLIAQLADERAGYVLSRDSDFLILCGNAPKCKGYIPLGTIEFIAMETAPPPPEPAPADDDGFMTVSTGKRGKKAAQQAKMAHLPYVMHSPVLPQQSPTLKETSLRFRCFSSYRCAELLKVPMSMLPVFAALVGTDHRTSAQTELFNAMFHGVPNRMQTLAGLLAEQYTRIKEGDASPPPPVSEDAEEEHALDMSDPVIRLLARTFDSIVEFGRKRRGAPLPVSWENREEIVTSMHSMALSYMPSRTSEAMERFMATSDLPALQLYQKAYGAGHFDQALVSAMLERIYIARVFLEEPDEPSSERVVVRPMRKVLWSILFSVWLTAHPEEKTKLEEAMEELEVDEEPDAAAEEAQDDNDDDDNDDDDENEEEDEPQPEPEPEPEPEQGPAPLTFVTEYTRTEYSLRKEEVPVFALPVQLEQMAHSSPLPASLAQMVDQYADVLAANPDLTPELVQATDLPHDVRMDLWRYTHHANIPEMDRLPPDVRTFAAALRYTIVANQERLGSLRTRHNWSMAEIQAAVYAACIARRVNKEATPEDMQSIVAAYPHGSPSNRSITLCTMFSFVLQTSALLTQSLGLVDELPHCRMMWEPPLFHACLGATMDPNVKTSPKEAWSRFEDPVLYDTLLAVVVHGLDAKIGRTRTAPASQPKSSGGQRQRRHLGLLEETML